MRQAMKNNSLTAMVFFLFVSFSFAVSALAAEKTFTLEQCLDMARERNPAILASLEKKVQAQWSKQAAYDDFLPKLNMDYGYTYIDEVTNINADFVNIDEVSVTMHNNYQMALHIDQPLFTGFRLMETYHLAELGLKEAVAGEELADLEIIYQTVSAYYNLLLAMKYQEVMDSTVIELTSHYNDSQQFYKNEIIPLNDLLESEVHLSNAIDNAKTAKSNVSNAKRVLLTIIKEPVNLDFTVVDSPDDLPLTSDAEILAQRALEIRPELKQANYGLEASRKQVNIARSAYYPTLMLSATHNRYGGDILVDGHGLSDLQRPEENMIGVYASWEIFAWGQTNHRVNAANAASRQAQQQLIKVMDEIQLEVRNNFTNAVTSYSNIATSRKAVEQALENLRMNTVRYKNQIATSSDVLDAQTLLTKTKNYYYRAIYNYNIWLAALARSVGVKSWKELN
jgi:outer membrane protein TolC